MYILLDIDGVLVSGDSYKKINILDDNFYELNINSVNKLNSIVDKYHIKDYILTTSHRNRFTIKEWEDIFKSRNIAFDTISIPNEEFTPGEKRIDIVNNIIGNKKPGMYIIIDDDKALLSLPEDKKARLILTNTHTGLI